MMMMADSSITDGFVEYLKATMDVEDFLDGKSVSFSVPFPRPDGDIPVIHITNNGNDNITITDLGFCDLYLAAHGIDVCGMNKDREKLWNKFYSIIETYNIIIEEDGFIYVEATPINLYQRIKDMCHAMSDLCALRLLNEPIRFVIPASVDRKVQRGINNMEATVGKIWGNGVSEAFKKGLKESDLDHVRDQVAKIIEVKFDDYMKDIHNEAKDLMERLIKKELDN